MDISQELNKGTNTIGANYSQPKTKLIDAKRIANIKQNKYNC